MRARRGRKPALPFVPYRAGRDDAPERGSVAVTAIVLTHNEEANIARCLESLAWCSQVLVVDSGSQDATVQLAKSAGARVLFNPWPGFAAQRQWALDHPDIRHDWVYFVDADEWVSAALAREISSAINTPGISAFEHRLRLIFLGRWIRHCGWYTNSWRANLLRRGQADFKTSPAFGERPAVYGPVLRLRHDIVDEDRKGIASWLQKHVEYAQLEAERRGGSSPFRKRVWKVVRGGGIVRSRARAIAKDVIYPTIPAKPLVLFSYMYIVRRGFCDGWQGFTFCCLHAWHEAVIGLVQHERRQVGTK